MNENTPLPFANLEAFPEFSSINYSKFNSPNSRQILRISINLKYIIDKLIPYIIDSNDIIKDNSLILNDQVINLIYEACGGDQNNKLSMEKYKSVLIFSLLNVFHWYEKLSVEQLSNYDLYQTRALTVQQICKIVIEREEAKDFHFLIIQMLLRKYSICANDEDTEPSNAVELATDLHCTIIIGSHGFQRALKWLWNGWIIQSRKDPSIFIKENTIDSTKFWIHFNPDRIKTPKYQNFLQLGFSIFFLILYTIVVNGKESNLVEPLDTFEIIFYICNLGHLVNEWQKFYYIGIAYFQFWSCFNDTTYLIIFISMVLRFICLSPISTQKFSPEYWDEISYRILSCAAPLVWSRLLLYLESQRFVGVMLVVLKHMMTESLVFFVLLFLIMIGFLQGFLGLDSSDGKREITGPILVNLIITIMGSGSFKMFENFAPPYAAILYYGYCFIVMIILLNILIALYTNAYQKVVDNADEEYMALMSQKTLRYIRAPDEDVYVPPLNLIEISLQPIFKLTTRDQARMVSHSIMTLIYFPILIVVALKEVKIANKVKYNRLQNLPDDSNEVDTIWNLTDGYLGIFDSIFDQDGQAGIRATETRNRESLELQREAENLDSNFSVPEQWYDKVTKLVTDSNEKIEDTMSAEKLFETLENKFKSNEEKIEKMNEKIDKLTAIIEKLSSEKD
ncbi:calcium channel Yvc1p [Monosporozyma unispora]|nr:hypothetical protein C6P44_002364 [Kazachstania unispora]